MENFAVNYWWVFVILICIILYKYILRFLFGMVIVPQDRIGLVTKKFVLFGENRELPDGRIIATKGEAGFQAQTLAPGLYFGKWFWQWNHLQSFLKVKLGWSWQKTVMKFLQETF